MKTIPLSQGKITIVDDEDFEFLNQFKWHLHTGEKEYAARNAPIVDVSGSRKKIKMHRFILNATDDLVVDHKDGNGLNNRKENLRLCTNLENGRNKTKPTNCSSDFKGIYWNNETNRWKAQINHDGKRKHLGYFDDEIEAAKTYDKAAKQCYVEFAKLNFPVEPALPGFF